MQCHFSSMIQGRGSLQLRLWVNNETKWRKRKYMYEIKVYTSKKNMRNPWTLFITIWKRAKQSERERDRHTCVHTHRRHGTITALNFKFNRSLHNLIFFPLSCALVRMLCLSMQCFNYMKWTIEQMNHIRKDKRDHFVGPIRLDRNGRRRRKKLLIVCTLCAL